MPGSTFASQLLHKPFQACLISSGRKMTAKVSWGSWAGGALGSRFGRGDRVQDSQKSKNVGGGDR